MELKQMLFDHDRVYCRDLRRTNFKSNMISLYILRPLSAMEASLGALLGRVLSFASADYPSLSAISDMEDDLYGAVVFFDTNKYRDQLVFEYKLIHPNYKLLPVQESLDGQAMAFFTALLKKPLLKDGLFLAEIFQGEKQKLLEEMDNLQKDPGAFAYRNCVRLHFSGTPYGIYKYGEADSIRRITNRMLMDYYLKLLQESPAYLYRHGDFAEAASGQPFVHDIVQNIGDSEEMRREEESLDTMQSILVQGYYSAIDYRSDQAQHAMLFSHIFGGYSNAVLFREIREKLGFCYYIYTKYDKYRNVMFINTGYSEANHIALCAKIEELLAGMQRGEFTEDDLYIAKLESVHALRSLNDRQMTLLDYAFIQDLFALPDSIEERVRKIEAITREDVIQAARTFTLRTEYHLVGKDHA